MHISDGTPARSGPSVSSVDFQMPFAKSTQAGYTPSDPVSWGIRYDSIVKYVCGAPTASKSFLAVKRENLVSASQLVSEFRILVCVCSCVVCAGVA